MASVFRFFFGNDKPSLIETSRSIDNQEDYSDDESDQSNSESVNCVRNRIKPVVADFHPTSESAVDEVDKKPDNLVIKDVDLLIHVNGNYHNTSRFDRMRRKDDGKRLVVRRGQEFFLKLHFNREFNEEIDEIYFTFTLTGVIASLKHGTHVIFPLRTDEELPEKHWSATLLERKENSALIKIYSPADAIIGKWKIEIDAKSKTNPDLSHHYNLKHLIYLLFNPWSKDDDVFLEDEEHRKEFILADTGYIWRLHVNEPAFWRYAQFEENILDCALYLVSDIAKVDASSRNDPIKISRKLTAAINSNDDDNGVLTGRWTQEYENGTPPWKWTGSKEILQQYYDKKQSVNYGQCWVFAGVLATVCRALGLPCRVVTNYQSAHDTEGSLTIDYFYDDNAKDIDDITNDSIWNFHVWNEIWMKRPDIGDGLYDGWQVVDATPQEASDGMFCCGPMSVEAIKNGDVLLPYDGKFIYSEVNADEVCWKYSGPTEPLKLLEKYVNRIGVNISTKAVGKWAREDLTHSYKHPEGSTMERESFQKALKQCNHYFSRYYMNEEFSDVKFDFMLCDKNVSKDNYGAILMIKNKNLEKEYSVSMVCCAEKKHYTGKRVGKPWKVTNDQHTIQPGDEKIIHINLDKCKEIMNTINDCIVNVKCLAKVHGTNYEFLAKENLEFDKPKIQITKKDDVIVDQQLKMTATFINPLKTDLTRGKFTIEAVGFYKKTLKFIVAKPIKPGKEITCEFCLTPKHEGRGVVIVKFSSGHQIGVVQGAINFDIMNKI
ncbi:annulin-like [Chelonus insularis]|uniref:annulin-like n=1 Tax=Chelonus insularis TaxID=460826 RepID=UPI00158BF725|nr:annulin-like [Chelonus insularis]